MTAKSSKLALMAVSLLLASGLEAAKEAKLDPLPEALSNNAVAFESGEAGTKIFSFMGIGPKKTWDAIRTSAYEMDLKTGKWEEKRPVPGVVGRIGASAAAVGGQVFIFGGYVVDSDGHETMLSDLNVFVPFEERYYRGKDIPIPVSDAVVGVYRERYIFLIAGRSKTGPVRNVQVYDTEKDTWTAATPIAGTPVFGHAGGIVGDTIVYVDGAYKNPDGKGPKYLAASECWMARIPDPKKGDKGDITKLGWTKLPAHPGSAHYRIAAGPGASGRKGGKIYFSGGTGNPYDFDGIGYDGQPAEPSSVTFAFDTRSGNWETITENTPDPTMDHRGLAVTPRGLVLVGGMEKGQKVTAKVTVVKGEGKK